MKFLKPVALLVALLAIAIGTVKRFSPTLFLKVPNVGFILWAVTGGHMPPYMVNDAWEPSEMRTWIKDGDLVVATGGKSGTTWMLFCTHQIRTKGDDSIDFGDVSYSTVWPDLLQFPGATWAQQKELLNTTILPDGKKLASYWNNPSFPFRIWKSHSTPKVLPVKEFPKVKFLAMARNGMDVVDSMVPFFDATTDAFRSLWGGFPPASTGVIDKDRESRIAEMLPGGLLGHWYFDYVNEWWPWRNEPNVLLMHYADAIKDLAGTVAKLADFLGVTLTKEGHAKVVEKCGMPYMKAHKEYFNYALPLNSEFNARDGRVMRSGAMVRKGGVGSGKSTFSAEQTAKWQAAEEEVLTEPGLLAWAREGGGW